MYYGYGLKEMDRVFINFTLENDCTFNPEKRKCLNKFIKYCIDNNLSEKDEINPDKIFNQVLILNWFSLKALMKSLELITTDEVTDKGNIKLTWKGVQWYCTKEEQLNIDKTLNKPNMTHIKNQNTFNGPVGHVGDVKGDGNNISLINNSGNNSPIKQDINKSNSIFQTLLAWLKAVPFIGKWF